MLISRLLFQDSVLCKTGKYPFLNGSGMVYIKHIYHRIYHIIYIKHIPRSLGNRSASKKSNAFLWRLILITENTASYHYACLQEGFLKNVSLIHECTLLRHWNPKSESLTAGHDSSHSLQKFLSGRAILLIQDITVHESVCWAIFLNF